MGMAGRPLPTPAFWHGRRVFLTGHTGFVGARVALWLADMGARVTGYGLAPPTDPSSYVLLGLGERIDSHIGDLRDVELLRKCVREANPEIALHLAAQPLVSEARRDPVGTFEDNAMGTVRLLDAALLAEALRALVVFTTDKVYDPVGSERRHRETDRLGGNEAYALSKASAEFSVRAYESRYLEERRIGLATVRAGNLIGGGDWSATRIVPDAIRAFVAGEPLVLRNPNAERPWQHVWEAVRGLLMLAEQAAAQPKAFRGAWNLGPRSPARYAVREVASRLAEHWGEGARWEKGGGAIAAESAALAIDSTKAETELGWQTVWTTEEAIEATVAWYRAWHRGADMQRATTEELEAYADAVAKRQF